MIKKYQKYLESVNEQTLYDLLPDSIKDMHQRFNQAGKKLFLVGGSVRDFKLSEVPKDFDLATDAMPDEIIKILKGFRLNFQGKAFGVIVAYTKDQPDGVEIATFRKDISKGRNPEVELGVTIEDDVNRRDLTYNAMFYDLDEKKIYDITGGLDDIESGITKMVGNALERIDEDSLRILRAFRFASRYGHTLDDELIDAVKGRKELENIDPITGEIVRVSSERILDEFRKAHSKSDFKQFLGFITEFDMWGEVFPGADINTDLVDAESFTVHIANLFRNENKRTLANKLVSRYKFPSEIADTVAFMLKMLDLNEENAHKLKSELDKKNLHVENIKVEDLKEWIEIEGLSDLHRKFLEYTPKNWGKELMDQGWKQGPELGKEINKRHIKDFKDFIK